MTEETALFWLASMYELGTSRQNKLLEHFGCALEIFRAKSAALCEILKEDIIEKLLSKRDENIIQRDLEFFNKQGFRFVGRSNEEYPVGLSNIKGEPCGLFVNGKIPKGRFVAIVGSRSCTEYGVRTAMRFAYEISKAGYFVISGMARGIDTHAAQGALNAGVPQVAALACGLDICYPPENKNLMRAISEQGAIISEYPLGVEPRAFHFPLRNRIISGVSSIVLVVESGKRSGARLTCDAALEQGREVWAIPGNITSPSSEGSNLLIKSGAIPALSPAEIIEALQKAPEIKNESKQKKARKPKQESKPELNPNNLPSLEKMAQLSQTEKLLYDAIDYSPRTLEEIIEKTGIALQDASEPMFILEIGGFITRGPGQTYIKL